MEKINPNQTENQPSAQVEGELVLTPEMAFKGDFENIKTSEEFLEAIDFDTLNTIFDELISKSMGVEVEGKEVMKISKDSIHFFNEILTMGENHIVGGSAQISTGRITLYWELKQGEIIKPEKIIQKLHTLLHEATHVRGSEYSYGSDYIHNEKTYEVERSNYNIKQGLRVKTHFIEDRKKQFDEHLVGVMGNNLNEAVTENISLEVLREYLIRTGNSSYLRDSAVFKEINIGSYFHERVVLEFIIFAMQDVLDIPRDYVWKGFVKEYMSENKNLTTLFEEIGSIFNKESQKKLLEDFFKKIDFGQNYDLNIILDAIADPMMQIDDDIKISIYELRVELLKSLEFKNIVNKDSLGLRG